MAQISVFRVIPWHPCILQVKVSDSKPNAVRQVVQLKDLLDDDKAASKSEKSNATPTEQSAQVCVCVLIRVVLAILRNGSSCHSQLSGRCVTQ